MSAPCGARSPGGRRSGRHRVISGVSRIPFLLGGLAAFGLIGLFVGPVIIAILLALWREWATAPGTSTHPPSV